MTDVVIAGAGPNALMLACELGLGGIRPVVLDPMSGPDPQPRVNRIVGQAARILDHRGLYSELTGTADPPKPSRSMFAGFPLDLTSVPGSQLFTVPVQQQGLGEVLAERAATATALLVRPDGYVAWASSTASQEVGPDIDELRGVLAHWFGI